MTNRINLYWPSLGLYNALEKTDCGEFFNGRRELEQKVIHALVAGWKRAAQRLSLMFPKQLTSSDITTFEMLDAVRAADCLIRWGSARWTIKDLEKALRESDSFKASQLLYKAAEITDPTAAPLLRPACHVLTEEIYVAIATALCTPGETDIVHFAREEPLDSSNTYQRLCAEFKDAQHSYTFSYTVTNAYFREYIRRCNPTIWDLFAKLEGSRNFSLIQKLKPLFLSNNPPATAPLRMTDRASRLSPELQEEIKRALPRYRNFFEFLLAAPEGLKLSEYMKIEKKADAASQLVFMYQYFEQWIQRKDNPPTIEMLMQKLSDCEDMAPLIHKINHVLASPYSPLQPPKKLPHNKTIPMEILQAPAQEVLTLEMYYEIVKRLSRDVRATNIFEFCKVDPPDTGEDYDCLCLEYQYHLFDSTDNYFQKWLKRGDPTVDCLLKRIEKVDKALFDILSERFLSIPSLPPKSPAAPQVPPPPVLRPSGPITTCYDLFKLFPELKRSLTILLANPLGTGGWESVAVAMSTVVSYSIDFSKIDQLNDANPMKAADHFIQYAIDKLWTVQNFIEALRRADNLKAVQMIQAKLQPASPARELTCDELFQQKPKLKDTLLKLLSRDNSCNETARKMLSTHPGSIRESYIQSWEHMREPSDITKHFITFAISKLWTVKDLEEALHTTDNFEAARRIREEANLPPRPDAAALGRFVGDVLTPQILDDLVAALARNNNLSPPAPDWALEKAPSCSPAAQSRNVPAAVLQLSASNLSLKIIDGIIPAINDMVAFANADPVDYSDQTEDLRRRLSYPHSDHIDRGRYFIRWLDTFPTIGILFKKLLGSQNQSAYTQLSTTLETNPQKNHLSLQNGANDGSFQKLTDNKPQLIFDLTRKLGSWKAAALQLSLLHPGSGITDDLIQHWECFNKSRASTFFLEYACSQHWSVELIDSSLLQSGNIPASRVLRKAANLPSHPILTAVERSAIAVLTPAIINEIARVLSTADADSNIMAFAMAHPKDEYDLCCDLQLDMLKQDRPPIDVTRDYLNDYLKITNPTIETFLDKLLQSNNEPLVQKFKDLFFTASAAKAPAAAPKGPELSPAAQSRIEEEQKAILDQIQRANAKKPAAALAAELPAKAAEVEKGSANPGCAICAAPMVKKAALNPCGHTYCLVCVTEKIKETCPTCREPIVSVLRLHEQDFDAK